MLISSKQVYRALANCLMGFGNFTMAVSVYFTRAFSGVVTPQ